MGSQTCAVAPSPVATEPRRAAALRCRGRAGKSPLDLGSARFSNCQPACSDCSVTLALPALPTFLPTIWGSCSATAFLLIDARAYTTRRANQVSSRQHRAYLQPNKCDSGLKTTYLRFPGKAAKLREISLFHLILSSLCTAFASIAFPSIPPAARFPLVSFLGSSSFCWQPGTWHEHLFAITHDIPLRPQQLLTSCRRDHPKSYSQTRPSCSRAVIALGTIQLPCPVIHLSTKLPQACRKPATAFRILRPPTGPYISPPESVPKPTIANTLGHDSNSTSSLVLSFFSFRV